MGHPRYLQMRGLAPREFWTGHYAYHQVTATTSPDFKSWCFPSRIEERALPFQRMIGDAQNLVDRHTLYPLYKRMLPPGDAAKVRSHLLGEPLHGLPAIIGAGGPHSGWATFQAAYCDDCVRDDIASTGVPVWHIQHQVPGGLVCPEHAKPLLAPCRMCTPGNWAALVPFPGRRCDCPAIPLVKEGALSEASFAFEVELARAADKLLDGSYLPQLDAKAIGHLVRLGAGRIGIAGQQEARHKGWGVFIKEPRLRESFERMSFHTMSFDLVGAVLGGHTVLRHPLRSIALLIGLWGSWVAVERAAHGACSPAGPVMPRDGNAAIDTRRNPQRRRKRERMLPDVTALWADYKRLRREQPGSSRTALLLQLPDGARDVLSRNVLDVADIQVLGDIPALDASMVHHFDVRLETLVAEGYPGRISSKQLLEGHPMGPAWFRICSLLPRATRALKLCAETKSEYLARMRVLPYLTEPHVRAPGI